MVVMQYIMPIRETMNIKPVKHSISFALKPLILMEKKLGVKLI